MKPWHEILNLMDKRYSDAFKLKVMDELKDSK